MLGDVGNSSIAATDPASTCSPLSSRTVIADGATPDERHQLARTLERLVADRADDRAEPVAELVRRHRGDELSERRGHDALARDPEAP